ncbi:hypothetical protein [Caldimonas brevitalea]|nr:hypothetical protein [Caldimonas brevitalea]
MLQISSFTCSHTPYERYACKFLGKTKEVLLSGETIEIADHDDVSLVLRSMGREIIANKRYRTIKSGDRVLALFDQIQSIEVAREADDEGQETWRVSLYISWLSRVQIGRTTDATEVSIVGARLSTITGKKVVAHR